MAERLTTTFGGCEMVRGRQPPAPQEPIDGHWTLSFGAMPIGRSAYSGGTCVLAGGVVGVLPVFVYGLFASHCSFVTWH